MVIEKKNDLKKSSGGKLRKIDVGRVSLTFTRSNLHVMVADYRGNALAWSNCGTMGFKGKSKNSPLVSSLVVTSAIRKALFKYDMFSVSVHLKGNSLAAARERALKAVVSDFNDSEDMHAKIAEIPLKRTVTLLTIDHLYERAGMRPFNGCRRRKVRRGY